MKKTKIALGIVSVAVALSLVASLAACSSEHEHTWDDGVTSATCTNVGTTTYTCTTCGEEVTVYAAALGHDYEISSATATCTTPGTVTYTCTRCGESKTDTLADALGHDYVVTTTATCTDAGVTTYTCSRCGVSYSEDTDAMGHEYEVASDVHCTGTFYLTCDCIRCGEEFTYYISNGVGHDYVLLGTTAATCTEDGISTYECARCGAHKTEVAEEALGHDWDEGTESEVDGVKITTYTCKRCGSVSTKEEDGTGNVTSTWDGTSTSDAWKDSKTSDNGVDTYEITTAAELAGLAVYVNSDTSNTLAGSVVELDADIDLDGHDWTPIGKVSGASTYAFGGLFDGNNHTISNLKAGTTSDSYIGLFGYIMNSESSDANVGVKDLTISNVSLTGLLGVGAVAGECDKNNNDAYYSTISNCTVEGSIEISGGEYVGGIVGRAYKTAIESCSVISTADENGKIEGVAIDSSQYGSDVGGIVGAISTNTTTGSSGDTSYSHIYDVTVSKLDISGTMYVGGIAGSTTYYKSSGKFTIGSAATADDTDADTDTTDDTADDTTTGNVISDCTISITPVTSIKYHNQEITTYHKDELFIGAVVGISKLGTSIEYCSITNVTVNYYNASCVYGISTDEETGELTYGTYAGYYGGLGGTYSGVSNPGVDISNCNGTVTLTDISGS